MKKELKQEEINLISVLSIAFKDITYAPILRENTNTLKEVEKVQVLMLKKIQNIINGK